MTADTPGIGGCIKARPEDFIVEEIPLYPFSGDGEHTLFQIEKKSFAAMDAFAEIAKTLGVPRNRIGYAGLKDARAVTTQWLSVDNISPEKVELVNKIKGIRILQFARHKNKIRVGHLAGNRFTIRVRRFQIPRPEALDRAKHIMEKLALRGVPNYYGPQRFGSRKDSHILGSLVLMTKQEEFIDLYLGLPNHLDGSVSFAARTHYQNGDFQKAHDTWPRYCHDQRKVLHSLIRTGGNKKKAFNALEKSIKKFYISAYQSDLFNQVLAARMPDIDRLLRGDMAYKHENGACFRVEEPHVEQPRCDRFEISPTGPLIGSRMETATGPAGEIENPLIQEAQLAKEELDKMRYYRSRGGRRPLRFQPRNIDVADGEDSHGEYIQVKFEFDSGCYATSILREIIKTADNSLE